METRRKVCLVGDFGVGKSSLVRRFVTNVFNERYETTLGVQMDTKNVALDTANVRLVIWDIAGTNRFDTVSQRYLEGADGILLVCDSTRWRTFHTALELAAQVRRVVETAAIIGLINKVDLVEQRDIVADELTQQRVAGMVWHEVSALSGQGVEAAFTELTRKVV
ncbi:MAG: Rab family GTPase [Thiotrichales bacterium]